jgi:hypothetical protein
MPDDESKKAHRELHRILDIAGVQISDGEARRPRARLDDEKWSGSRDSRSNNSEVSTDSLRLDDRTFESVHYEAVKLVRIAEPADKADRSVSLPQLRPGLADIERESCGRAAR